MKYPSLGIVFVIFVRLDIWYVNWLYLQAAGLFLFSLVLC